MTFKRIHHWLHLNAQKNFKGHGYKSGTRRRIDQSVFKTYLDARCLLCTHSANTDSFISPNTNRTYQLLGKVSCHIDNYIILSSVPSCSKQYLQVYSAEETASTVQTQRPKNQWARRETFQYQLSKMERYDSSGYWH